MTIQQSWQFPMVLTDDGARALTPAPNFCQEALDNFGVKDPAGVEITLEKPRKPKKNDWLRIDLLCHPCGDYTKLAWRCKQASLSQFKTDLPSDLVPGWEEFDEDTEEWVKMNIIWPNMLHLEPAETLTRVGIAQAARDLREDGSLLGISKGEIPKIVLRSIRTEKYKIKVWIRFSL